MKKPVDSSFVWIDPATGKPTQYFLELIQNMHARTLTMPVSTTEPTNGQVVKFVSSTGLYTPGTDNT